MVQSSFRRFLSFSLFVALVTGVGACDTNTGPTPPSEVRVMSGGRATDTVDATLPSPLVVQVIPPVGHPASGIAVQFVNGGVRVTPVGPRYHTNAIPDADTTDDLGLVRARVELGTDAGEDSVIVRVPALERVAVARYTVRPGAAVGVAVLPADTVVYVDRGFRLRGSTVDRLGNVRGEPVAYSVSGEAVLSGDSLIGRTIGRAKVTASARGWTDDGWVSVVPRGTVVAVRRRVSGPDTLRLVVFNLDGSGLRSFDLPYWSDPQPDWAPSGGVLVWQDPGPFPGFNGHLVVGDSSGVRRRLIDSTAGFVSEYYPQYSADGSWIYFAGARPESRGDIWRVRSDGSGPERVGPQGDGYTGYFEPSPSPDGTRVALARTPACCYDLLIEVLDLATGQMDSLRRANGTPIAGVHPRWSPTADVIAYNNAGQIWLIQPDGSNERTGSPPGHSYGQFDWSPDGRWLIADSDVDLLYLIEPTTGLALPLAFTQLLTQPSWRP